VVRVDAEQNSVTFEGSFLALFSHFLTLLAASGILSGSGFVNVFPSLSGFFSRGAAVTCCRCFTGKSAARRAGVGIIDTQSEKPQAQ